MGMRIYISPKICEIKLEINDWVKSRETTIQNMAIQMLKKFESYRSVIHDILAIDSVLDPRYKMDMLEYYFYNLYGYDFDLKLSRIRQMCYDLVLEYQ